MNISSKKVKRAVFLTEETHASFRLADRKNYQLCVKVADQNDQVKLLKLSAFMSIMFSCFLFTTLDLHLSY